MGRIGLAAAILIAGTTGGFADPLDHFLDGMLNGCQMSGEFDHFKTSLAERAMGTGKTYIPAEIRDAVGRASVREESEYYEVNVPLSGTWHGLPVRAIGFSFGKENGIHAWGVEFAASAAEVKRVFGPTLARSRKIFMSGDDADMLSPDAIDIINRGGVVSYICDMST